MSPRTLVVGADGSPASSSALAWAADHAAETGARVVVVLAIDANTQLARDLPPTGLFNWRMSLEHDVRRVWIRPLVDAGVEFTTRIVEDPAPRAIMDVADAEDADLIVIGTHGHGSLRDRFQSSVSYRVIHSARQPVTVIPPDWVPPEHVPVTADAADAEAVEATPSPAVAG